MQITDTIVTKTGNVGGFLLSLWKRECKDRNNKAKISNFIGATKSCSSTSNTEASTMHPMGDSFMYIETSGNNYGQNAFVSFQRIYIMQISHTTFFDNRFSIKNSRSRGRLKVYPL